MKRRITLLIAMAFAAAAIWAVNSSLFAPALEGPTRILAHRGIHQDYDSVGLTAETCTAARSKLPLSPQIENTVASMRAAISAGADVVEIDVHPTTDGTFAVFHDWTLDCRTNGTGRTRDHDMAALKALDIGHGYTFDGGKTFPLRGKGIGLMPSINEVMAAFPDGRLLVNFKSRDAEEGARFAALLEANPAWREAIWGVYGGAPPTEAVLARYPDMLGVTQDSAKSCLITYFALGWSGYVPASCRDTIVLVPENVAPWLWGWPNRFVARMQASGSEIVLRGPHGGASADDGIDTAEAAARVPRGFPGLVWTNDVVAVAPVLLGDR